MAQHHQDEQPHESSPLGKSSADDEAARIAAALAKLKDPPKPEALVGSVVTAGSSPAKYLRSDQEDQESSVDSSQAAVRKTTEHTVVKKAVAVTKTLKTQLTKDGPLDAKDLLKLGEIMKQKSTPPEPVAKAETIAPTNPDPQAAIAFQIAEKKRAEEEATAAVEAEKWHVEQAKIQEATLNKPKLYRLAAYWLCAIPTAFLLYQVVQLVDEGGPRGFVGFLVMLPIYGIGFYGVVGWVPLVLEYLKVKR